GPAPERQTIQSLVVQTAQELKVPPDLALAMARIESNFNPTAVSLKGAAGVMQLMPATAKDEGVTDVYDPWQNIHGGLIYMRKLLDEFHGDQAKALAAYNWGASHVERGEMMPPETREYLREVQDVQHRMDVGGINIYITNPNATP